VVSVFFMYISRINLPSKRRYRKRRELGSQEAQCVINAKGMTRAESYTVANVVQSASVYHALPNGKFN
jgi:hypothetical protein